MTFLNDLTTLSALMVNNSHCCYRIYDQDGKNLIAQYTTGGAPLDAFNSLQNTIKGLSGIIEIETGPQDTYEKVGGDKTGKNAVRCRYKYVANPQNNNQVQNLPAPQMGINGMPSQYELMNQLFELKLKLMEMELKNKLAPETFDKENEKTRLLMQNRLLTSLEKIFMNGKGNNSISEPDPDHLEPGPGPAPANMDEKTAIRTRAINALKKLEKKDADFYSKLEKLAQLAETNPDLYNMASEALKNF